MNQTRLLTESALWSHAWWLLRHSHLVRPFASEQEMVRWIPRFLFWEEPCDSTTTEHHPYSVTVYQSAGDASEICLARYAQWSSQNDLHLIRQDVAQGTRVSLVYEPTILIADFTVKQTQFLPLFQNLTACSLPSIGELETQNDLDGARVNTTGFEVISHSTPANRFTLQWSTEPAERWQSVMTAFKHVRGFLLAAMREAGTTAD